MCSTWAVDEAICCRRFGGRVGKCKGRSSREHRRNWRDLYSSFPVAAGHLADIHFPKAQYDAVVMWHVLEHVTDPSVGAPGGLLSVKTGRIFLVATPNWGSSPEAHRSRDKWFHLDVPRHQVHFTGQVLKQALMEHGFQIERSKPVQPRYRPF